MMVDWMFRRVSENASEYINQCLLGILKSETVSDIAVGRFFIIPYSKYLETIDQLRLSRDAITVSLSS